MTSSIRVINDLQNIVDSSSSNKSRQRKYHDDSKIGTIREELEQAQRNTKEALEVLVCMAKGVCMVTHEMKQRIVQPVVVAESGGDKQVVCTRMTGEMQKRRMGRQKGGQQDEVQLERREGERYDTDDVLRRSPSFSSISSTSSDGSCSFTSSCSSSWLAPSSAAIPSLCASSFSSSSSWSGSASPSCGHLNKSCYVLNPPSKAMKASTLSSETSVRTVTTWTEITTDGDESGTNYDWEPSIIPVATTTTPTTTQQATTEEEEEEERSNPMMSSCNSSTVTNGANAFPPIAIPTDPRLEHSIFEDILMDLGHVASALVDRERLAKEEAMVSVQDVIVAQTSQEEASERAYHAEQFAQEQLATNQMLQEQIDQLKAEKKVLVKEVKSLRQKNSQQQLLMWKILEQNFVNIQGQVKKQPEVVGGRLQLEHLQVEPPTPNGKIQEIQDQDEQPTISHEKIHNNYTCSNALPDKTTGENTQSRRWWKHMWRRQPHQQHQRPSRLQRTCAMSSSMCHNATQTDKQNKANKAERMIGRHPIITFRYMSNRNKSFFRRRNSDHSHREVVLYDRNNNPCSNSLRHIFHQFPSFRCIAMQCLQKSLSSKLLLANVKPSFRIRAASTSQL